MDLTTALATFGHDSFRPGQREAIETLLEHGRLLLVAPTGGGKSLTYQLPACMLEGTTLVISPLIALMADQVRALEERGIAATYLSSTLSSPEFKTRLAGIARGRYRIAYVAPERLTFPGFRSLLADLTVPLLAVDEAHCISEWGHDFRPEYRRIAEVLELLPQARLLACTATATPVVRDEILGQLGLPSDTPQVIRGFARPNLALAACEVTGAREREERVDATLARALADPRDPRGAAIIYAPTRAATEKERDRLLLEGWRVDAYHAGLAASVRNRVQDAFSDKTVDVVVATNAFGMGIDRADVRAVIHLGPPSSIEAYYQEVGRAGRDGERAWGMLCTSAQDFPLRRRLIEADGRDEALVEHKWGLFLELMRWAEGGSCRHDAVLRYFGDEAEALSGCGICDNCESLADQIDETGEPDEQTTLIVRKALSGVARIHGRYGLGAAVKLLKGRRDARLERSGLTDVSTFGVLAEHSEAWIQSLVRRCVTAGWIDFYGQPLAVAVLTEAGKAVMKAQRPARLILPARARTTAPARRATAPRPATRASDVLAPEAESLFESLRSWRLERARDLGVPPYVIASDRTLRDIANLRPRNLGELELAHGIGPAKREKYGPEMLRVVAKACRKTPTPPFSGVLA